MNPAEPPTISHIAPGVSTSKLMFLTRSLNLGGAERQLVTLAKALRKRQRDVSVASFYAGGSLEAELVEAGVTVHHLNKRGTWDNVAFQARLVSLLRSERPAILHSYLGTPNLAALAAKPFVPGLRVIWGVRASDMDLSQFGRLSRWSYRAECTASKLADCIIANSHAGRTYAVANGFPASRTVVVPNGIDTHRFTPDRLAGQRVRDGWGIDREACLIGLVARLDPMKDHPTFLRAAARIAAQRPDARFVMVGEGPAEHRDRLVRLSSELGLGDRIVWAGARTDMVAVYNALDICCLSSMTEGFPNVIGEAMACDVPCVVTNVGDAAWIVGDTGEVVPRGAPHALADAVLSLAATLGERPNGSARKRIVDHFSLDTLVRNTEDILWPKA